MRALWHIETLATAAIVLVAFLVAWPASAQQQCGKRTEMVAYLAKNYQEQQRGVGLVSPTVIFELLISPSGSWTMFASHPNGMSCLVGTGQDWQFVAPKPDIKSSPS